MINNQTVKRITYLLSLEKNKVIVLLFVSILLAFLESVSVALIFPIVGLIVSGEISNSLQFVIETFGYNDFQDKHTIVIIVLALFIVVTALKVVVFISNLFLISNFTENLRRQIAVKSAEYCIRSKIGETSRSDMFHIALQESGSLSKVGRDIIDMVTHFLVLASILFILVSVNKNMVSAFLIVGIVVYAMYRFFLKNYSLVLGRKRIKVANRITSHIKQIIDGSRDLFTLRVQTFHQRYITDSFDGYGRIIGQVNNLRRSPIKIIELLIIILFSIMLLLNLDLIEENKTEFFSSLAVFFVGLLRMGSAFASLYGVILSISSKLPVVDKAFETIFSNYPNSEQAELPQFMDEVNSLHIQHCEGKRTGGETLSLKDFHLQKGNIHAILGESGIGKTTLSYMLCGLMKTERFSVSVNNEILESQDKFREKVNVVYVPQLPVFFDTTLLNNLLIGSEYKSVEEVKQVIKLVGLSEWLNSLEDKENQILGDKGLQPSGGQMKRLALARALLLEPQVLIIDEPTSGLDNASEDKIIELLQTLSETLIVVAVTHSDKLKEVSHYVRLL